MPGSYAHFQHDHGALPAITHASGIKEYQVHIPSSLDRGRHLPALTIGNPVDREGGRSHVAFGAVSRRVHLRAEHPDSRRQPPFDKKGDRVRLASKFDRYHHGELVEVDLTAETVSVNADSHPTEQCALPSHIMGGGILAEPFPFNWRLGAGLARL